MERLKAKATRLRKNGKTYYEIRKILGINIPKSTLSYWCKGIVLPKSYNKKIENLNKINLTKARMIAQIINDGKKDNRLKLIINKNKHLARTIKNKKVAKIALAMLYLGEGSRTRKSSLMFGNSDPVIISLFLYLLRYCYVIDEKKFRCTLQCRADQDIKSLEKFWSHVTRIPPNKFYKAQIDPRTINRPTKNPDYKGVCRIDYFSADLFMELTKIVEVIKNGLIA